MATGILAWAKFSYKGQFQPPSRFQNNQFRV